MKKPKQDIRYVGIDNLRGWLIVLVMLGHIVLGSVHENIFRYAVYAFHMPVFIGLTGYLINASMLRNSTFISIFQRYWWRVLFPFAFAYLFYTGILIFHAFEEGRVTVKLLLSYIHTPYYHLWFIPTMVIWVFAFAMFVKLKSRLLTVLLFFGILSLTWAAVPNSSLWGVFAPFLSKKVVYFFSFFLFGAWLKTSGSERFRSLFREFKALPLAVLLLCASVYLLEIGGDKSLLKALVWSVLNLVLITVLIEKAISNGLLKPSLISGIGRNSLPIYLWHVAPLFLLKGFDIHQTHVFLYYGVATISMMLIVALVLKFEARSKLLNKCLYGVV